MSQSSEPGSRMLRSLEYGDMASKEVADQCQWEILHTNKDNEFNMCFCVWRKTHLLCLLRGRWDSPIVRAPVWWWRTGLHVSLLVASFHPQGREHVHCAWLVIPSPLCLQPGSKCMCSGPGLVGPLTLRPLALRSLLPLLTCS